MFRWISIIGFAVVIAGILLHVLLFSCRRSFRFLLGKLIPAVVHPFTLLSAKTKLEFLSKINKLIFLLCFLSFCVLLITGFGVVLFGCRLAGYQLIIHVIFAPVFIGCIALLAVLNAARYSFSKKDAEAFHCRANLGGEKRCWLTDSGLAAKAGFWGLLVLSIAVTMTIVLSMLPIFGTHGQTVLFNAHRWCALIFALTAIIEIYVLLRAEVLKDTKISH